MLMVWGRGEILGRVGTEITRVPSTSMYIVYPPFSSCLDHATCAKTHIEFVRKGAHASSLSQRKMQLQAYSRGRQKGLRRFLRRRATARDIPGGKPTSALAGGSSTREIFTCKPSCRESENDKSFTKTAALDYFQITNTQRAGNNECMERKTYFLRPCTLHSTKRDEGANCPSCGMTPKIITHRHCRN